MPVRQLGFPPRALKSRSLLVFAVTAAGAALAGNDNTFAHTFTTPGSTTYHCSIHPYMTGTVEVTR